jgi:Mg-chelatase subunit ChlD
MLMVSYDRAYHFIVGHPVAMRILSLAPLLLVLAHCGAPSRVPPGLIIAIDSRPQVRVQAEADARLQGQAAVEVQAEVETEAEVQVETRPRVRTRPAPPPPPRLAVPLEQAEVVEFFGIPLDDAQDIVFVLDRSGSMAASAKGRIAQLGVSATPPAEADAPAPEPASSGDSGAEPAPEDPGEEPAPEHSAADEGAPEGFAEPGLEEPAEAPELPPPPSKLAVAHRELVEALEGLPAGTRVNVLYFNDELEAFAATLFPLEDQSRAELIDFVTRIEPTGATALGPAMRTAFLMNARRVVLLSDGLGNVGGGASAVLRDAREAMRGGVRIDTIGLGYGQDYDLLRSLANESGGLYQDL